jgi:hypothetical protein
MHQVASQTLFQLQVEGLSSKLADSRGWIIHDITYPTLDVTFTAKNRTPLRLQAACHDWNSEPPNFKLLSAAGIPLQSTNPPPSEISPNTTGVFNASVHPLTGVPFICSAGAREYHMHSSHTNDHWDNYRNRAGYDLGGLLTRFWHAWLKGTG